MRCEFLRFSLLPIDEFTSCVDGSITTGWLAVDREAVGEDVAPCLSARAVNRSLQVQGNFFCPVATAKPLSLRGVRVGRPLLSSGCKST